MTRLTCCLIALAAAAVVQTAQATCTYPPEVTVPDGKTATDAEMKAANAAVKPRRGRKVTRRSGD
jgi:hypothetical protein